MLAQLLSQNVFARLSMPCQFFALMLLSRKTWIQVYPPHLPLQIPVSAKHRPSSVAALAMPALPYQARNYPTQSAVPLATTVATAAQALVAAVEAPALIVAAVASKSLLLLAANA